MKKLTVIIVIALTVFCVMPYAVYAEDGDAGRPKPGQPFLTQEERRP